MTLAGAVRRPERGGNPWHVGNPWRTVEGVRPHDPRTSDTRVRVLRAAQGLFLRRGYAGTTIDSIAQHARVSAQTIYNVVGGKAAVLKAVYDLMLAGDTDQTPIRDRPAAEAMRNAPDGVTCLRLYAGQARGIWERVGPLVPVMMVDAAGDRQLRTMITTVEDERATGTRQVASFLAERYGLRPRLSVAEAGDLLWALTAPELTDRLVRRRGWSLTRWEQWLGELMADAVLPRSDRDQLTRR